MKNIIYYYLITFFIVWCGVTIFLVFTVGGIALIIGAGTIVLSLGLTIPVYLVKNYNKKK